MAAYSENPISVVAVAGPTAIGKTAVAIELAQRIGGEIICADSMQIYRGLDIGTAKPTPGEMAQVPHHMYGTAEPTERYSVARYIAEASRVAREIYARGKMPIFCGGTGQYISAFLRGVSFTESETNLELREQLYAEIEKNGARALIGEIAAVEPEFAAALHENNKKRIVRAVELLRTTGYTIPQQNELSTREKKDFFVQLVILNCSDRKMMYNRIESRVEGMIAEGLLDEAKYVYDNRVDFATAVQAIGYKEFFEYFEGEKSLGQCVEKLKQATRNYAKRQLTWFRRENSGVWYNVDDVTPGKTAENIEKNIKNG